MASRSDIQAGKAHVSLYVKNSAFVKDLNAAKDQLQGFGSSIMGIGTKMMGLGAAITAPLLAAVNHFSEVGSALNDMSARTGMSVSALAELGYAAGMTGAELGDVETGTKKMQKAIAEAAEGSKTAKDALAGIGLTVEQLQGLKPEEQFQLIADGISATTDPALRTAAAMELMGKSGTKLIPMMQELAALRKEAQQLGLAPSDDAVQAADDIGDAIDKVKAVLSATVFEVGAALAPVLMPALETVKNIAGEMNKWVKENGELIRTVFKIGAGLMAAGAAAVGIGATIFGIGTALGAVASAAVAAGAVVAAVFSPVGLAAAAAVAGLAAAIYSFVTFTETGKHAASVIGETFGAMWGTVKSAMGGIADAIMAGDLTLAAGIAMTTIQLLFQQGLEAISGLFGETISVIAGDLLKGDLVGAWETVAGILASVWDGFTAAFYGAFESVVNGIVSLWNNAIKMIQSSLDALSKASAAILPEWANEKVQSALGAAGAGVGAVGAVGGMVGAGANAAAAVSADNARRKAMNAAADAGLGIAGKGAENDAEAMRLQAQLDSLRQQAAAARVAAETKAGGTGPEIESASTAALKGGSSAVTFSGAALQALGGGASMQQLQQKQLDKMDRLIKETEKNRPQFQGFGA